MDSDDPEYMDLRDLHEDLIAHARLPLTTTQDHRYVAIVAALVAMRSASASEGEAAV